MRNEPSKRNAFLPDGQCCRYPQISQVDLDLATSHMRSRADGVEVLRGGGPVRLHGEGPIERLVRALVMEPVPLRHREMLIQPQQVCAGPDAVVAYPLLGEVSARDEDDHAPRVQEAQCSLELGPTKTAT